MRIDNKLSELPLTTEQHYFASCWYNMVHEFSLDSFRVQAMNPGNGVRELIRMLESPANSADLEMVASELKGLLSADPVLKSPPFLNTTSELLDILNSVDFKKPKTVEPSKPLLRVFARELHSIIRDNYVEASLTHLEQILIVNTDEGEDDDRLRRIRILTNYLLSTLIDRGASLESVFQLYRQILSQPGSKKYVFEKRLGLLRRIITQEKHKYIVVFIVDNISKPDSFPIQIGDVEFSPQPPEAIKPTGPVSRYLSSQPRRLFAQVEVETKDYRTAGTQAYSIINNILDLVRFEYEHDLLALHNEFVITGETLENRYRLFPLPKVVPNPTTSIDEAGLHGFIGNVNDFVHNSNFSNEERSRVQSAFRLYRTGADSHIFENKLVSWWTATEYLVKGNNNQGSIGSAVENTLYPVLCLGYLQKLLLTYRHTLVDEKIEIRDLKTKNLILLKDLSICELYQLFKGSDYKEILTNVSNDVFLKKRFNEFLNILSDPTNIHQFLKKHEQRLRWHIQRLYRARCDIVHSAEQIVNAAMLCANLEFYLKSTLISLLHSLGSNSNITGPKEFFDRQRYTFEKLLASLEGGDDERLIKLFEGSV